MGSSVFNKYPQTHTFGGKKVLNLGCGFAKFKAKNVINLDAEDCSDADIIWNLANTPLPFEDETFDLIIANHILEHVPNWWNCFEDCSRILKVGGTIEIWVPGAGSDSVLGFRDHINTINHCSFWGTWGLNRAPNNAWAKMQSDRAASVMRLKDQYTILEPKKWLRILPKVAQNWCALHLRNVIYEMGYVFEKMKSPQQTVYLSPAVIEAL